MRYPPALDGGMESRILSHGSGGATDEVSATGSFVTYTGEGGTA